LRGISPMARGRRLHHPKESICVNARRVIGVPVSPGASGGPARNTPAVGSQSRPGRNVGPTAGRRNELNGDQPCRAGKRCGRPCGSATTSH
jgi:hypothetical protein